MSLSNSREDRFAVAMVLYGMKVALNKTGNDMNLFDFGLLLHCL
jgi:hypothetical protein